MAGFGIGSIPAIGVPVALVGLIGVWAGWPVDQIGVVAGWTSRYRGASTARPDWRVLVAQRGGRNQHLCRTLKRVDPAIRWRRHGSD